MSEEKIFGHDADYTPFFRNFVNIRFEDFTVYCLNVAIGSGALKLGYAFRAGLIFSLIIFIKILLLIFSMTSEKNLHNLHNLGQL